jgi:hypothetical protein
VRALLIGGLAIPTAVVLLASSRLDGGWLLGAIVVTAGIFVLWSGEPQRISDLSAQYCVRARGPVRVFIRRSGRMSVTRSYVAVGDRTFKAVFAPTWGPFTPDLPRVDIPAGSVDYTAERKYVLDIRDEEGHPLFRQSG